MGLGSSPFDHSGAVDGQRIRLIHCHLMLNVQAPPVRVVAKGVESLLCPGLGPWVPVENYEFRVASRTCARSCHTVLQGGSRRKGPLGLEQS